MNYLEQKFDLPMLDGITPESVAAHIGLYGGYVKNFNALTAALEDLRTDSEKNAIALAELVRRQGFEFDGMRLHEYFFTQWEKGMSDMDRAGGLASALGKQFGSVEAWLAQFQAVSLMRGIGWAILYFDPQAGEFHNAWVSEHQVGHFATVPIILTLDMWEHAFLAQFGTTGKKAYIDAAFKNFNWEVMEERFSRAVKK